MLSKSEQNVKEVKFFDTIFALVLPSSPKPRIHNFTHHVESVNYVLDAIDGGRSQITAYGKGIKRGDYIIIGKDHIRYRVEAIDYYADPPNLWTAQLLRE